MHAVALSLLLLGGCLASAPAASQPPATSAAQLAPVAAPAPSPATGLAPHGPSFERGTLWRVTAANGAQSHVLGTLHIGQWADLAVPDQAWQALSAAQRLIVEVELDRLQPAHLGELQRMPGGRDWSKAWAGRDIARLKQRLQAAGWTVTDPGRIRPWVLVQALALDAVLPAQSLDEALIARARAQGHEVLALESVMEQFASFDCVDTTSQLWVLRDALNTPGAAFRKLNAQTLDLYAQQRVGDLVALQAAQFPQGAKARQADAALTRCVIEDRNRSFLSRLAPLLVQPGQFVALGAAHLVGPRGLLAGLVERGFVVQRLHGNAGAARP